MKIICIGRNYRAHVREMSSELPAEPVFFMKPESAIPQRNLPFFYPDFSNEIHYEAELVLRICKLGKHIEPAFAHKYYDAISLGIDFTARDIQKQCKEKGLPWEKAKAFDGSAPIGKWKLLDAAAGLQNIHFRLEKNGEVVQNGQSSDMLFSFDALIAHISKYVTLKTGDLIFTGTPEGVGPVQVGDLLEGFIEGEKMLGIRVR